MAILDPVGEVAAKEEERENKLCILYVLIKCGAGL